MEIKIFDSELKVMELIWEKEPISAKELSVLAEEQYGWNKNTTYTVVKKIEAKGYICRIEPGFICKSLVSKKDVCKSETKGLIDCIKSKITDYNKARIRSKASTIKMSDYNFFDENFSYLIEIPLYEIISGKKHYYSADDLISIYRDKLKVAYNNNKSVLRAISDR